MKTSRWRVAGAVTIGAMTALLAGCGGGSEPAESGGGGGEAISFVSFGGDLQDAQQVAWTEPASQKFNLKINQDGPTDYAKLRAQVESGNVTWDTIDADSFFVSGNCGTLFDEIDRDAVDLSNVDPELVVNDCGVPVMQISWILVYDNEKFGDDPPSSFADFFDTERYPGKRAVSSKAQVGVVEATLLGDGVEGSNLYPLDLDRAFKKLDTVRDELVFYENAAQAGEQMLSNSVVMAIVPNGRAYEAVSAGATFDAVWKDNIRSWDNVAIVKGQQNPDTQALLNYIATPEAQAALAEEIAYGPTTPKSQPDVDELLTSYLASNPDNVAQSVLRDQSYWAENFDLVTQRYTEWQTG